MDSMQCRIISTAKSIMIFALAALTVFQVSQLWFVNITDRTFFLYIQARFAPRAPDGHEDFVVPFRVIYGAGDGIFNLRHSGVRDTPAWGYALGTIEDVLAHGDFVGRDEINRGQILPYQMFMFEYAFEMCPDIFSYAFGQRSGVALTGNGIEGFRRIALLPPRMEGEPLTAFFMDDVYAWEFSLPHTRAERTIVLPVAQDALHFVPVSGDLLGFIPVQPPNFVYHPVGVVNPYQSAFGTLTLSSIRNRVEPFFNNPATINQRPGAGGIYTFSNMNTMVRYHLYDVIEYTSFRTIGTVAQTDLIGDFSAALNFVRSDEHITNEFFLAGYEPRGRANIFWFDYIIDDFPLVLSEPWHTGPACVSPLPSAIEVVVDNGRVVHYRRLVHNFHVIENVFYNFTTDLLTESLHGREIPYMLGFTITREAILDLEVIGG